jgi:cytidylate kinase
MKKNLIIAIDGPAGSGKSTVAKEIARKLGLLYVDTGAMYRALTLKALREKISFDDEKVLVILAQRTTIDLEIGKDFKLSVLLDGEDVSKEIREFTVTNNVKYIARIPEVRKEMVLLQRKAASTGGAVLEGRDIGTVVFPNADRKIYLDAGIDERINRRYKELVEKGYEVTRDEVEKDVIARDHSDKTRTVAPLKKADGAIIIDTTNLTIAEVSEKIIREVKNRPQATGHRPQTGCI